MGLFDKLKNSAMDAVGQAAASAGSKRETITFAALPKSLAQMQALPEASQNCRSDGMRAVRLCRR